MATSTEQHDHPARPSIPKTPLFAVVGATDLAVQQVRAAAASASSLQQQFRSDVEARLVALDPKALKAQAEQAPNRAVARALEVAVKAEAAYEELARRGKDLVERVYTQNETQTFRDQAGSTLNRGLAAVTVARRAADDTASAIRSLARPGAGTEAETAKTPADEAIPLNLEAVQEAVAVGDGGNQKPARAPRPAAKKAPAVKKSATATKNAVKATGTSARKTAATGTRAAKSAAKKVGED